MLSVGKLFAVAAILALVLGFVRWPQSQTGFYTITIKNRAYGLGSEYWAFPIAAIFALLAAAYYWLPILISLDFGHSLSLLHFWLSAISAFAFLLLLPVWNAFTRLRNVMSEEREAVAILVIMVVSTLLFLLAQVIFVAACVWSVFYGRKV
jgi:heme/copper-type cytochrome/quinol oxidase subunit 1